MRLQHNIMAKSAYRGYKKNVSSMKKNLERLSSGYKINRAADDAAGLAISEKMRAQITGEETAHKNAKDGISLVQTAEGALTEVHDILDRMVELATQSANGTYDNDTDRYQLQKEMDLLMDEIDRIADSSNYNGLPLLDGSMNGGGGTVYPSGPVSSIELLGVGQTQGENTVLHTDAQDGSANVFSVGLSSVILNANSSISIAIGDNITITVTNKSDKPVTAEDIAAAIAGDSSKDIAVDFGDAKVGASEDGGVTVTLGRNSVFGLKASGSHLIFTQIGGSGIKMPQDVTITDADAPPPKVDDTSRIEPQEPDTSGRAKYTIDLSSIDMTAPGNVTIEIFGQKFDLKISDAEYNGSKTIGQLLAEKLTDALNAANLPPDKDAGALTFTNNRDGTITLEFGTAGQTPAEYDVTSISVTTSVYQDGKTVKISNDLQFGNPDGDVLEYTTIGAEIDGEIYKFRLVPNVYADKYSGDDVIILGPGENWDDQSALDRVMEKLSDILVAKNNKNKEANNDYHEIVNTTISKVNGEWKVSYEYIEKRYIGISGGSSGSGSGGGSTGTTNNFSGDYDRTTTVLQTKQSAANDPLASTVIELKPDMMANGASIIIGGKEYTFTTDKTHTDKITANENNLIYVGDLDLSTNEGLKTAIDRLTVVSENNGVWSVGYGGEGGKVTLREKVKGGNSYMDENGADAEFDLKTLGGIKASLGWRAAATVAKDGKALTLQIGDTSDSYNQLQISIRDCRTAALGIANISIADQDSAQAAISVIRSAINYVSDVRGTLGATQNRLDHTINNLSVMAENIQDAESTIRDADIAEEMMAYTRNNILLQSAQAMLAQANQIPQGVLQLLQ